MGTIRMNNINWFVMCNGVGYLLASVFSAGHNRWGWFIVWLCYGISAIALSFLED